ncbi:uncharacterized protein EAF02_011453 [Botrytis sinoallii]|uniref:uncharacterized protein n=1 Tax=Botrytis sinoallii TaxID=1463999 RepID=UPI0018FFE48F|nr:uncharacterized protein EAF02_011453 [Botrytis sinoallii]KAF7856194.1 hypothetical protein EAF02_011453 [Botrytis sinoallii]
MSSSRAVHHFVSPEREVNAGIWSLFGGATVCLVLRLWCKLRRQGLWWDDYILILSWVVLLTTDIFISYEFATGYVVKTWNDRMLILVSISSCLTTAGQTWSKSAFAVTLLRMTNNWQKFICVATLIILNVFLVLKVFVNWSKYCGKTGYQNWWRMPGFCVDYQAAANIKVGGNIFNIVADFVLALFPWMVTWKLKISLKEKIALCITMSLGVVVAIISAVRTAWMDDPSVDAYNDYYFWRQGLSMVWYSAEVAGTIIVQSIPLMRPLVNDMHTSLVSKKLGSGADGKSYGPGKSNKSTNRRTLTLILQGCDVKDDENDVEDQKRVDIDRMHLTQDENGKIVLRRRTDSGGDVNAYQNSRVTSSARRLEEEEIGLTEDQKDRMVVSSEYYANGGLLEDIPEYHAHRGPLEEIPEYHSHGEPLEEIPEYRTIGGKEHIPMTEFHAVTC